jgi:hypothetical protein
VSATCFNHLVLHDLIILIISRKKFKLRNSSLIISLLVFSPHILLSTLDLCSFLNVSNQILVTQNHGPNYCTVNCHLHTFHIEGDKTKHSEQNGSRYSPNLMYF